MKEETSRKEEEGLSNNSANHSIGVRIIGQFLSYVFHPLFIPLYTTFFLVYIHPYLFSGEDALSKLRLLLQVFVNCTLLPLASVLLLKGLKFVDSIFLETKKERIIPYVICMVFYFWNWYAFKNNLEGSELVAFSLALFISSIFGYLINIFSKISMHAMAVGVMSGFMAALLFKDASIGIVWFLIVLIITGLTLSARLIVSNHQPKEIFTGLVVGIISMLLANYLV